MNTGIVMGFVLGFGMGIVAYGVQQDRVDEQRICTPIVPPHISLEDAFPPSLPPGCVTTSKGTFTCI